MTGCGGIQKKKLQERHINNRREAVLARQGEDLTDHVGFQAPEPVVDVLRVKVGPGLCCGSAGSLRAKRGDNSFITTNIRQRMVTLRKLRENCGELIPKIRGGRIMAESGGEWHKMVGDGGWEVPPPTSTSPGCDLQDLHCQRHRQGPMRRGAGCRRGR